MDTRIGVPAPEKEDRPAWRLQSRPMQWNDGQKDMSISDEHIDGIKPKTKDDLTYLIYVLELSAEVLESSGHTDLAAECESICEVLEGQR